VYIAVYAPSESPRVSFVYVAPPAVASLMLIL
jgi:hypothetical protein